MGQKPACKMLRANRAKQFMPFAALKGLDEALRKKEKLLEEKVELSESMIEDINRKFLQLEVKKNVTVKYFFQGEYIKITGIITAIDKIYRILRIVNTKISFDDIVDIELID